MRRAITGLVAGGLLLATTGAAALAAVPEAGETVRASVNTSGGATNDHSIRPAISADGTKVAFRSQATNLVPGGVPGIYVRDLSTDTTTLVLADPSPNTIDDITELGLSGDGAKLVFTSKIATLVPDDTNGRADVFVKDLLSGTIVRPNVFGSEYAAGTTGGTISDDGTRVLFRPGGCEKFAIMDLDTGAKVADSLCNTRAGVLSGDGDHVLYVRIQGDQRTPTVSGWSPFGELDIPETVVALSGDGSTVGYTDDGGLYVHDVRSELSERVDVDDAGQPFLAQAGELDLDATGRLAVFSGRVLAEDVQSVWLRDRAAGTTTRISPPWTGDPECVGGPTLCASLDGDSAWPSISADGHVVAFQDRRPGAGYRIDDVLVRGYQPATDVPDVAPPDATVTAPHDYELFTIAPVTFSGEATDDIAVAEVRVAVRDTATQLWWNGVGWQAAFSYQLADLATPATPATSWSLEWAPPATGSYRLQVIAVDAEGKIDPTKPWVPFRVDTSGGTDAASPDIAVTSPGHRQVVGGPTVVASGQATDDVAVAAVRVALRDNATLQWWGPTGWQTGYVATPAVLDAPGTPSTGWSVSWPAPATGDYGLQAVAEDTAGKIDKRWVPFSYSDAVDLSAPDATVTTPARNQVLTGSPVTFTGTATDDQAVAEVRVAIRDTTTQLWWGPAGWQGNHATTPATLDSPGATSTTWTLDWAPPAPGTYALQVAAVDAAGTVDPTKPWVPFSSTT